MTQHRSDRYAARIARAVQLAATMPEAAEILQFYAELAKLQKTIFEQATDEPSVDQFNDALMCLVKERSLSEDGRFLALAMRQPHAEYLASHAKPDLQTTSPVCPFCGSKPVVGVLRGEGEGAKRSLICSLCSTEWLFRRVACPNCGEGDKDKLPVFIAEQTDYVRVEACDTCSTYIKSIDLTRNGHAIPVVDEIATVALSIWADEHGYTKVEPNLLGM